MRYREAVDAITDYILTGCGLSDNPPVERNVVLEALKVFENKVPNPSTGLVQCGCGGTPNYDHYGNLRLHRARCPKCRTVTDWNHSLQEIARIWNEVVGYHGPALVMKPTVYKWD